MEAEAAGSVARPIGTAAGRQPKANPRFVVTTKYRRIYCQRGEVENRMKELKAGVSELYYAQFRVLLSPPTVAVAG